MLAAGSALEVLRDVRDQLVQRGRDGAVEALGGELEGAARDGGDLTFRLVESLIYLRADGAVGPESPLQAADAGLILCGLGRELPAIRAASRSLIDRLA